MLLRTLRFTGHLKARLQMIQWNRLLGSCIFRILEYENMQNPFIERRNVIIEWKKIAAEKIGGTENVVARASEFTRHGVKSKDALHIACAIEGKAEYFLTTDDKLLKKLAEM